MKRVVLLTTKHNFTGFTNLHNITIINIFLILKKNIKSVFGGKNSQGNTILVFCCGSVHGKRHYSYENSNSIHIQTKNNLVILTHKIDTLMELTIFLKKCEEKTNKRSLYIRTEGVIFSSITMIT